MLCAIFIYADSQPSHFTPLTHHLCILHLKHCNMFFFKAENNLDSLKRFKTKYVKKKKINGTGYMCFLCEGFCSTAALDLSITKWPDCPGREGYLKSKKSDLIGQA